MKKQILSERFELNWRDALKGLLMAVGTPVLYYVQEYVFKWDLEPVLQIAISAAVTYLLKNFLAPTTIVTVNPNQSEVKMLKMEKNQ